VFPIHTLIAELIHRAIVGAALASASVLVLVSVVGVGINSFHYESVSLLEGRQ
jgi:hypothetical protein